MKLKLILFLGLLFGIKRCYSQPNYPKTTMFLKDITKSPKSNFTTEIKNVVDRIIALKGRVTWVDDVDWKINSRDKESIERHYKRYGPYVIEFLIGNDSKGNPDVRNFSIIVIEVKSGNQYSVYRQNIYISDLSNAINIVFQNHIRTIDIGQKSFLYVDETYKKDCNNYNVCFNSFFNNHYLISKYYVQSSAKIEGEGRIVFSDKIKEKKDKNESPGFVFKKKGLDISLLKIPESKCRDDMSTELEEFCKKVTDEK